jgi:thymidylate kinase
MKKLIVLEGPDAIGKTTQAKILLQKLDAEHIVQPSEDNLLGFLRKIVKEDPSIKAFPRQLLHTCSHIVDAFTKMQGDRNILMDRCHASSWVYGKVSGMETKDLNTVHKIHEAVYGELLKNLDVRIVFLDRRERYNQNLMDEFERTVDWSQVAIQYRDIYNKALNKELYFFNREEKLFKLDVADFTQEEVTTKLLAFLQ